MGMNQNEPVVPAAPSTTDTNAANRAWWSTALGRYVVARRNTLGLTVTQACAISGLQLSEWLSLEEGWIPENRDTICDIAATLNISWSRFDTLAQLVRIAQKCR